MEEKMTLTQQLEHLLNREHAENKSNTPDFILAEYMMDCLRAYEKASLERERWYGVSLEIGMDKSVFKRA